MNQLCRIVTMTSGLAAALAAGCNRPASDGSAGSDETPKPAPAAPAAASTGDDHHHQHAAPHGGVLVPLGDHAANVEFVLHPDEGTLTAYIFDGCAEKPIRIGQREIRLELAGAPAPAGALELKPVANALTGEAVGDSSEFTLTAVALKGATRLSGRITTITIRGIEFRDVPFAIEMPAP